jgi:hypothetical protein
VKSYDVVIFDDVSSPFSPRLAEERGLGGVEWTLMLLAQALAEEGLEVLVLNKLDGRWAHQPICQAGWLEYGHYSRAYTEKIGCEALIVSRWSAVPPIETNRVVFSMHDIPARWMFARTRKWLDGGAQAVCVSTWLADKIGDLGGRSGYWRCPVIAPMLRDECYERGPKNPNVFVYASAAVKGLPETIDTWELIREHYPETHLTRLLAGTNGYDVPSEREALRMYELGISSMGSLPARGVIAALREAAGLFFVNTYPETHCLHPDTRISVPGDHRGGPPTVRIADVVGKSGFPVWAYDVEANRFKIATCNKVWQTKIADEMVAIDLDSGATLRVTPDHLVMTYDREWVPAGELRPGQRLLALNYRYNVAIQDGDGRWRDEHRLVGEWMAGRPLRPDEHVDHMDPTRLDNRPEMLTVMSQADHISKTHVGKRLSATHKQQVGAASRGRMASRPAAERMADDERLARLGREHFKRTEERMLTDPVFAAQMRATRSATAAKGWETRRAKSLANHKVVSVRRIAGGPVFDMEVEGLHNFIAEEIVVHNCIIAATALALGCRTHVLTLDDPAALPETLAGAPLLTRDKHRFVEDFVRAYRDTDQDTYVMPRELVPDRRADALLPAWKEVLFDAA